jgi:DNA modification methylase
MQKQNIQNPSIQLDLFNSVLAVYAEKGQLNNAALYSELVTNGSLTPEALATRAPIGQSGELHSPERRKVRWFQQTLKKLGLIERVSGSRGVWRAAAGITKDKELTPASPGVAMVAFSTKLGLAIWGDCRKVFTALDEPIHLCLTSPPYCLSSPRAYGNPSEAEYVDFICEALEPIVRNLVPGGSVCLNVSNDIFVSGSPARSMYRERMVLALHDRLGLHKMDELIWLNPSKAPGPVAWASKKRVQLNVAYEPIYWFTNDPHQVRSNNQRVLQPHSEKHLKLIAGGGEARNAIFGDGSNRVRVGSYGNNTAGKIPRNVITAGHRCARQTPARDAARAAGLPVHGAAMPFAVADHLVKFLTQPGDLVVEPFAGYFTTAQASEENGCRWVATDLNHEYPYAGSFRFEGYEGFSRELSL